MRENTKKIKMNIIYIYIYIMEIEICKHFVNRVLPEIEKVMVVSGYSARIKRMELIEGFLSSIRCTTTPWHPTPHPTLEHPSILDIVWHNMLNPFFENYPQLIHCKFTDDILKTYILGEPDRQSSFRNFTCSDYIENILVDILNKFRSPEDVNRCINLLICPTKTHFQQFIMYTRTSGSDTISSPDAMKHYAMFMYLTSAIIKKKIEMFAFPSWKVWKKRLILLYPYL